MENQEKSTTKSGSPWGYRIILIVAGLILGINIYGWNASKIGGNEMPMPFGTGVAVVLSGSMEPELNVHDLVIIREAEEYKIGDIVVYQNNGMLVIHRIVAMEGEVVCTKGDANNAEDLPIALSSIKGKLIFTIPGVGALIQMIKTAPATILILAGAILLMEMSWRKEKEQDEEKIDTVKEEIRRLKEELNSKKGD